MNVRSLKERRYMNCMIFVVCCLLLYPLCKVIDYSLSNRAFISGVALFLVCVFLMLFNARKKLSYFPLVKASTWLQFHIYAGFFVCFLFLFHIDFKIPTGLLECILTGLFLIVVLTGVFGVFITRYLPPRMTGSGESLIYENMATYRMQIIDEVESLILKSEKETGSSTLSDYFIAYAADFFQSTPSIFYALSSAHKEYDNAVNHLSDVIIYLKTDEEKALALELMEWIETKRNLDFQESSQKLLKGWLFVHIPFTYSMMIFAVFHAFTAILYMMNS